MLFLYFACQFFCVLRGKAQQVGMILRLHYPEMKNEGFPHTSGDDPKGIGSKLMTAQFSLPHIGTRVFARL